MKTISKIIMDLENGLFGLKEVLEKVSKRTAFASSLMEYEAKIRSEDYRYFVDRKEMIAF
ncbi:hypothetical protein AQPE_0283 [Aquipluma nitroreducens]|uniref:Uncharacterized protein n=1 Tax=Aquipluma nitroreducens TaxID=2010828 RepID=A0A5K7S3P1_9BACT|nr:hypothetical protein [Aquipluma nitroreducens]BBE16146.1 hypothetical protein AQPE_0283 [Aquipluma nitroreducens]